MGYTAYKYIGYENRIYGFVIAGHAVKWSPGYYLYQPENDVSSPEESSNNYVGGPDNYYVSKSADCAFVPYDVNDLTSAILRPNDDYTYVYGYKSYCEVEIGETIYKMGIASGETHGIVVRKYDTLRDLNTGITFKYVIMVDPDIGIIDKDSGLAYILQDGGYGELVAILVGHVYGVEEGTNRGVIISVTSDYVELNVYPILAPNGP